MSYSQEDTSNTTNQDINPQCDDKKLDQNDINFFEYMKRTIDNTFPDLVLYLTSLMLAVIIILLIRPVIDNLFPLFVLLMSVIIYVIRDNMTGNNLKGSLPFVTTPRPPHLGLAGVNLENRYPYQYV
jgi:hypothetical protein